MHKRYGWRALGVVLLLALGCKLGVAQIGPRYVLELPVPRAAAGPPALAPGRLQLLPQGLALLEFQGVRLLMVAADAEGFRSDAVPDWPAVDLLLVTPARAGRYAGLAPLAQLGKLPVIVAESLPGQSAALLPASSNALFHPMQTWDALHLRKGKTRVWVTAMAGRPGAAGVGGFLLELGNNHASYRLYLGCEALAVDESATLAQRLPGADLALLPGEGAPQLLALRRGAAGGPAAVRPEDGGAVLLAPRRR
ncbi:MAG: hypothetical protein ACEQSK_01845 [Sphingomonadaceae bacterium]